MEMVRWDTNYYRGAYYAVWGIGVNIPQDAVYRVSQFKGDLEQLNSNGIYKLSIPADKRPEEGGFSCITAYNNQGYVTPNDQNKSSSGSNTPLVFNKDSSFII